MTWRRLALLGYAALVGISLLHASCSRGDDEPARRDAEAASPGERPGAPPGAAGPRIITIGGPVTETVFALGAGGRVVATDTSSTYPAEVDRLPRVGYQRTLAAETLLAHRPDLIIASPEAGPAAALEQLRAAGVRIEMVGEAHDGKTAAARIRAIGAIVGKPDEAARLAEPVAQVVAPAPAARPPRVLFLYARGGGVAMVAGSPSAGAAMIELGGGVNAITGFTGYKPLAGEAVIEAAPDVVLLPSRGLAAIGGPARLWELPGLAQTPAGAARRVVAIDDQLLLGFGPRLATAVEELRGAFAVGR